MDTTGDIMLKEKKLYVSQVSDLAVFILKIYYESDKYIKAKCRVENKHNHIQYEIKTFKLLKSSIAHWRMSDG